MQDFGKRLTDVVNGDAPLQQKQKALRPLIDADVDVDMIARFCLGRFTNSSTPQQIAEYTRLFHSVLINNISSKIGEYRGVTFSVGSASARGPDSVVNSVVTRPNNAPNNVQWVVNTAGPSPKIVDVVAEGTSLRLTQRSDYASYLSQHGNNVDSLIAAMRAQLAGLKPVLAQAAPLARVEQLDPAGLGELAFLDHSDPAQHAAGADIVLGRHRDDPGQPVGMRILQHRPGCLPREALAAADRVEGEAQRDAPGVRPLMQADHAQQMALQVPRRPHPHAVLRPEAQLAHQVLGGLRQRAGAPEHTGPDARVGLQRGQRA